MDILFRTAKFEKECNNDNLLQRRYGQNKATRLRRRLDELRAAEKLADLRTLPQARAHELKEDRSGQLAVDLDHPYRLIFEPAHEPVPQKPDGGLDWDAVTAVRIIEVVDYHG